MVSMGEQAQRSLGLVSGQAGKLRAPGHGHPEPARRADEEACPALQDTQPPKLGPNLSLGVGFVHLDRHCWES